ncbi:type II toxin-antitoxin system RelE/ParE family toxin [Andreprevotia chitinilytica]|uniref:type II toxin-antitoxin system RelE/ParE family toxin n=1 Tax=Andreprevotia chitinilytica TaxID=396808 RepID=UPI0006925585|nr:type II toxin-antitoxin system RelE/ParE family toxin [Andreprevotia chitinilytica]
MLHVFIQPEAAQGLEAAVDYYAQAASPALAERFLIEFETTCANLAERPGIGSLRFAHLLEGAELRTWSLTRFPFRLFYFVEGDTLNILGVEHERRNIAPVPFRSSKKPD